MKALVLEKTNEPLRWQTVHFQPATKDWVEVDLKAAALNHRDLWIAKGQYAGIVTPIILGSDGAGLHHRRAVIINPSVNWGTTQRFQSKEYRILGLPDHGTFATSVWVPAENLFDKPPHLNWEQAAAIPLAGLTAWRVLFSRCQWAPGEKVLVTGAGGGVALFAIQFALAAGAEVWVTSGKQDKIERVIAMGAAGAANYHQTDWDKDLKSAAGGFDIIIDAAAGNQFPKLIGLANPGARIGVYGGTLGKIDGLSLQPVFWKQISILGSTMGSPEDFSKMLTFINDHKIVPVVDSIFDLDQGNEALARMDASAQFGKIILKTE